MPRIVDVYFYYEEGNHSTITGTSGNPGYTKLPQYWVKVILDNGEEASINLKSDFKDLFEGTRITRDKREAIKTLIENIRSSLLNCDVKLITRSYVYAIKSHWQKKKYREYEKRFYIGLDDNSLNEIKKIIEKPIKEILSESN